MNAPNGNGIECSVPMVGPAVVNANVYEPHTNEADPRRDTIIHTWHMLRWCAN